MTEDNNVHNITEVAADAATETKTRLQSFVARHPRTAKVAGIIAITGAVLGAVSAIKNRNDGMVTVKVPAEDVTVNTDSAILD